MSSRPDLDVASTARYGNRTITIETRKRGYVFAADGKELPRSACRSKQEGEEFIDNSFEFQGEDERQRARDEHVKFFSLESNRRWLAQLVSSKD